nr:type VI secretion system membrane subunit TssM [uncultured Rhodopila sp.]
MAGFLRWLTSRWFLTGIGVVFVGALIWLLGPLWDPLASATGRASMILSVFGMWSVLNLWADLRQRRRDAALIRGVTGSVPVDALARENADAQVAGLNSKLTRAMALLKQARGTRGYLYEQPWYVMIGPPGAGKTTALLNANLTFPLADRLGSFEVGGAGPTRLCEWYFIDQAVLIDTAGRYTTQDSDPALDRSGWNAFLSMLKRTRPRQPLNGVLVAISLHDVALGASRDLMDHATAIRRRLKELRDAFGIQLPVYMIFTKADLIAGFTEYFDDLNRDGRSRVWGATFPDGPPAGSPGAAFSAELTALVERLSGRRTERLQEERSLERRAAILGFPSQVASLDEQVSSFLDAAFGASHLDPPAWLRGVYFASGTQEGTPIDRIVGALARGFGIDPVQSNLMRPDHGRSYFLEGLLKHVVFREAMLASRTPADRRRQRLLRLATWGGAGAALVLGTVLLLLGWTSNAAALSRFDMARAQWWRSVEAIPPQTMASPDLHVVAPVLDQARALPFGPGSADTVGLSFGFSQQGTLDDAAGRVYRHALESMMLPRLVWRAEQQVRTLLQAHDPAGLYRVTRVYMMLGSRGPMDARTVHDWAEDDWSQRLYPGVAQEPLRKALLGHLDALLSRPLPEIPLDDSLITEARVAFSTISPAERVYALVRSAAATGAKPFIPSEVEAAEGNRWFSRARPAHLSDPVAGLFTPAGFWNGVRTNIQPALGRIGRESWILGPSARSDLSDPRLLPDIERDVVRLYAREYIAAWSGLLETLDINVAATLEQQGADLWLLSRPQSPIRGMLAAILPNLTLAQPPAAPAGQAAPPADGFSAADLEAAKAVDDAFRPLRDFAQRELDPILQGLEELARQVDLANGGGAPSGDAARRLLALVKDRPEPIRRWITALATSGQSVRGQLQRRTMLAAYSGSDSQPGGGGGAPGPLCRALERRYPFAEGGGDTAIDDFTRVFAPNSAMDQFFTGQVRSFVNDQGNPWRPVAFMGVQPPIGAGDAASFQRIDQIRKAFFGFGTMPRVTFLVQPLSAAAQTKTATLELGRQDVVWDSGASPRASSFEWPGPDGMTSARLSFDPPTAGSLSTSGPWALFRLLAKGQRRGGDDHFQITFVQDDRSATFDFQTTSGAFAPGLLRGFHCPTLGP